MHRLTLLYLVSYLFMGGIGFLMAPEFTLRLLQSTGDYGVVMPRVVGMFMLVLSGLIYQFVRNGDYRYYAYAVLARSFIVIVLTALYLDSRDPLFLVLDAIVLIGLVPSMWVVVRGRAR